MRIVILLVRAAAGHEDRAGPLLQPAEHMVIEELSSIVAIQPSSQKAGFSPYLQSAEGFCCPRFPDARTLDQAVT